MRSPTEEPVTWPEIVRFTDDVLDFMRLIIEEGGTPLQRAFLVVHYTVKVVAIDSSDPLYGPQNRWQGKRVAQQVIKRMARRQDADALIVCADAYRLQLAPNEVRPLDFSTDARSIECLQATIHTKDRVSLRSQDYVRVKDAAGNFLRIEWEERREVEDPILIDSAWNPWQKEKGWRATSPLPTLFNSEGEMNGYE